MVLGDAAQASASQAVAIGSGAQANGAQSISIGTGNIVSGARSGAIGDPSTVTGTDSYVLGNNNTIAANNAFVVGNNVTIGSGLDGAVALGNNSTVSASTTASYNPGSGTVAGTAIGSNVVSIGAPGSERRLTNVAAGGADTDAVNVSQLGAAVEASQAHYFSVNSNGPGNYNNDGAAGLDALAIGVDAFASDAQAIALGSGAAATGSNSLAIGSNANTVAAFTVAIGDFAEAFGFRSVALGRGAQAFEADSIALGSGSVAETAAGVAGYDPSIRMASGDNSSTWLSTAGAVSVGDPGSEVRITRQITSVAAGTEDTDAVNVAQLKALETVANAGWNVTDAGGNTANIGPDGRVTFAGDGNIAVTQTGSDQDGRVAVALNKNIDLGPTGSLVIGNTALGNSGLSLVGGPKVMVTGIDAGSKTITNLAAGTQATDAVNVSQLNAAVEASQTHYFSVNSNGSDNYNNDGATGLDALAIGVDAAATNAQAVAIGGGARALGFSNVAIGSNARTTESSAIAIGDSAGAFGVHAIALGRGAAAGVDDSVALGYGSIADRAAGVAGYDPSIRMASGDNSSTWLSTAGAVSIGNPGSEVRITRQITGVAAGTEDTDAVNVAQLKALDAVASAGWNVTTGRIGSGVANAVSTTNVAPGDTVQFTAGDNIVTTQNGAEVQVALNSSLTGITRLAVVNGPVLDASGVTIAGGPNQTVTLTNNGLDNGGNMITNVAAGANPTDAVNVSQLSTAVDNVNIGFVGNSGGTVTRSNGQNLTIRGEGTTAGAYSGANSRTSTDPATGTVNILMAEAPKFGSVVINDNGTGKITGVTAATLSSASTDAVNGSQLVALGDSIAASLSPGSTYDPATNVISARIAVGGNVYSNVQDAIRAVNPGAFEGWNITTAATGSGVVTNSSVTNIGSGGTATFVAGNNIAFSQNGSEVQVALNPDLKGLQSIAISGGPTIDGGGIDMGGDKITNVGAGVLETDAVNVGQLNTGLADAFNQANHYTDTAITAIRYDLSQYRRDANGGTASAMAMSAVPLGSVPGKSYMGFGVAHWQGEQAIAIGFAKTSNNGRVVVKASGGYNTRNQAGAAVGVGFEF